MALVPAPREQGARAEVREGRGSSPSFSGPGRALRATWGPAGLELELIRPVPLHRVPRKEQ